VPKELAKTYIKMRNVYISKYRNKIIGTGTSWTLKERRENQLISGQLRNRQR